MPNFLGKCFLVFIIIVVFVVATNPQILRLKVPLRGDGADAEGDEAAAEAARQLLFIEKLEDELREGIEASLIVSILLAYLKKIERPDGRGAVWAGTLVAAAVSVTLPVEFTLPSRRLLTIS